MHAALLFQWRTLLHDLTDVHVFDTVVRVQLAFCFQRLSAVHPWCCHAAVKYGCSTFCSSMYSIPLCIYADPLATALLVTAQFRYRSAKHRLNLLSNPDSIWTLALEFQRPDVLQMWSFGWSRKIDIIDLDPHACTQRWAPFGIPPPTTVSPFSAWQTILLGLKGGHTIQALSADLWRYLYSALSRHFSGAEGYETLHRPGRLQRQFSTGSLSNETRSCALI